MIKLLRINLLVENSQLLLSILFSFTNVLFCSGQIVQTQQDVYAREGITLVEIQLTNIDTSVATDEGWVTETFKLNRAGRITESKSESKNGEYKTFTYHEYVQDTMLTEMRSIHHAGATRRIWDMSCEYNSNNQLKVCKYYFDNKLSSKTMYYYKEGLLTKTKHKIFPDKKYGSHGGKSVTKFYYDSLGRVTETVKSKLSRKDKSSKTSTVVYSADGLKKSTYKSTSEHPDPWLSEVVIYGPDQFMVEYTYHISNPTTGSMNWYGIKYLKGDSRKCIYTYDPAGLVTEEKVYKNDELVQTSSYTYHRGKTD